MSEVVAAGYTIQPTKIRWRLNDPGEENRVRWTKTHLVLYFEAESTLCKLPIGNPYMVDYNADIPTDWPVCQRCQKAR